MINRGWNPITAKVAADHGIEIRTCEYDIALKCFSISWFDHEKLKIYGINALNKGETWDDCFGKVTTHSEVVLEVLRSRKFILITLVVEYDLVHFIDFKKWTDLELKTICGAVMKISLYTEIEKIIFLLKVKKKNSLTPYIGLESMPSWTAWSAQIR